MADTPILDYPQSGDDFSTAYYPGEDPERVEAEQAKASIVSQSYPVMEDVAAWFDRQIADCDSRRNILAYAATHNTDPERTALAFDIVRELLEIKRSEFGTISSE